jgi:hypothetical protein
MITPWADPRGVTFAFGVTKGPDILSRLFVSLRHASH